MDADAVVASMILRHRLAVRSEARVRLALTTTTVVLLAAWMGASAQGADHPVPAVGLALCSLGTLTLLRRAPVLALAGSLLAPVVVDWAGGSNGPDDVFLVLIVAASYAVGRHAVEQHQPYIGAGVLALTSMNIVAPGSFVVPQQLVFPVLVTGAPWALGLVVRRAAERESRAVGLASQLIESHQSDLREATVQERLRVARELHDVTAHTMSVVSLHAQVMRRRIESGQPLTVEDASAVETSARQAMRELREMVAVLRPDADAPTSGPSMEDLLSLVEECQRLNQVIDLHLDGPPQPMSSDLSRAAYRIVQECLTNARRHGADRRVDLAVRWTTEHLELRAANACDATIGSPCMEGVGLTGVRERVTLLGGEVDIGLVEPGTWHVRARLPISRSR